MVCSLILTTWCKAVSVPLLQYKSKSKGLMYSSSGPSGSSWPVDHLSFDIKAWMLLWPPASLLAGRLALVAMEVMPESSFAPTFFFLRVATLLSLLIFLAFTWNQSDQISTRLAYYWIKKPNFSTFLAKKVLFQSETFEAKKWLQIGHSSTWNLSSNSTIFKLPTQQAK